MEAADDDVDDGDDATDSNDGVKNDLDDGG